MNDSRTRIIMTAAALVLGSVGLALLFAPHETSVYVSGSATSEAAGQLVSAGFLALAVVNWIGRGAVYGGIYGRPIVLGNFLFGFILGTTSLRAALESGGAVWALAEYGVLHTAAFSWMLLRSSPTREGVRSGS
ncbi:MAG: hypothetical protein HKN17_07390 [Rhodothermales bacterium]|nr:hypothetical protein [Rhodothermales bacterium]